MRGGRSFQTFFFLPMGVLWYTAHLRFLSCHFAAVVAAHHGSPEAIDFMRDLPRLEPSHLHRRAHIARQHDELGVVEEGVQAAPFEVVALRTLVKYKSTVLLLMAAIYLLPWRRTPRSRECPR